MPVTVHHWAPFRRAVEYAEQLAMNALNDGNGLVVELGPGNRPFRLAAEFVGRDPTQSKYGYSGTFHQLNLSNDSLPWNDGEVAFLYCRHTLEDLDDPEWCLSEIRRVARAGYIETPSPIAELSRGVDVTLKTGATSPWRGYHHHRSIVWDNNGTITVLAKLPFIEHVNLHKAEDTLAELLNSGPLYWNTYFAWTGPLPYRIHRHEVDYEIGEHYGELLDQAVAACIDSAQRLP